MKAIRNCRACKAEFKPRVRTQLYCTARCANRKAQERLRKRAKLATRMQKEAKLLTIGLQK